jgi:TetR/AcrR family transcriptional regulator, transcriptional repressor for nem operon
MGRTSNADQKLMDATLDLIWEESYGAVTIDDICQRAGVKTGSFYYFFKSKADLAVAALERLWKDDWKPSLDRTFSSSVDPLVRLQNYFGMIYEKQLEAKKKYGKILGCPVCSVGSEVSTQEADISSVIREMMARKRRYYESAIRDAVAQGAIEPCDPAEEAVALFALLEGLITQARITNDPEILRRLPAMALSLLKVKAKGAAPAAIAAVQG